MRQSKLQASEKLTSNIDDSETIIFIGTLAFCKSAVEPILNNQRKKDGRTGIMQMTL